MNKVVILHQSAFMKQQPQKPVLVWFRQDLRLQDNPALCAAHATGQPILPVYILDDVNSGKWKPGAASRWWLHESLTKLNAALQYRLHVSRGSALEIIEQLVKDFEVSAVFWNRCYEPWRIQRDKLIKQRLKQSGIEVRSFNAASLFEPQETLKADGTPYRVFTPFYTKGCLKNSPPPSSPIEAPRALNLLQYEAPPLSGLSLLPSHHWYENLQKHWQPGEAGAMKVYADFIEQGLEGYKEGRDFPARRNVSRLSPHLHFGEISPHTIWYGNRALSNRENDRESFLRELVWREFSNSLLFHFPYLPEKNLQEKYDQFPWKNDQGSLEKWTRGQTGIPTVDAGMRELWQTGYMHNRVRMIVASFLVKNLLIHWKHGAAWFWDTLVDADLANNSASWQWVAGCGADAAPFFRIFNPVTQGQKFDADGRYVRKFVPELRKLPDKYIHSPWTAPESVIRAAGLVLGKDYPLPMVDLKATRQRALDAFRAIS